MSSGLILDDIIINLFTDSTEKQRNHIRKIYSPKLWMIQFNCTNDLCRILHGKENADTKNTLRLHHFIEREKLGKYISIILSIDNDEADIGNKANHFINDIRDFNNKHIIKCNNKPISTIPDVPHYI